MKNITPRLYQLTIAKSVLNKGNTLVVLPTGLGKTVIALLVAEKRKELGKILVLAPTRPLVLQHKEFFEKHGDFNKVSILTGSTKKEKRKQIIEESDVIISTPQTIENSLLEKLFDLSEFSLLVVDECHRTVGKYAYKTVVDFYVNQSKYPLILGLTASPSAAEEKIQEIMNNLRVKNIEVRTPYDEDVRPYIQNIQTEIKYVHLPEYILKIRRKMYDLKRELLEILKNLGYIRTTNPYQIGKKEILSLQNHLQTIEDKNPQVFDAIVVTAALMNLEFFIELLETQGISICYEHMNKFYISSITGAKKSARFLVSRSHFLEILNDLKIAIDKGHEHPKIDECVKLVLEHKDLDKILIFCQYRNTANILKEKIPKIVSCERFVGQATKDDDKGLSQKQQKEIIERFAKGEIKVLISTTVGEEGIDIPAVDLVIYYEPTPSEIRHIQRRGRTGRHKEGKIIILVTKNTRDEAYLWASRYKEKKMLQSLRKLKEMIGSKDYDIVLVTQNKSNDIKKLKIIADNREKSSNIIKNLISLGVDIKVEQLDVGDYVISEDVCIERKSGNDFIDSMIDGRLFDQLIKLKQTYKNPILIVEGKHSRNISENSYYGLISSIILDYKIPILFSKDEEETTKILLNLARREQLDLKKEVRKVNFKKSIPLSELQLKILESFPHIGPKTAKKILEKFKTIKRFINAGDLELFSIEGFGKKIIKDLKLVLETPYEEAKKIDFDHVLEKKD